MIAFLQGRVMELGEESLVLNVNDVGYEIFCSSSILQTSSMGEERRFFIHTHVREDSLSLFGFLDMKEKKMFLSLLKVNGVGAKMAMTILSGTTFSELLLMIEANDVKGLTRLPKVGKKKAEQIILSLKGQLVMEDESKEVGSFNQNILSALVNLGFKGADVEAVVRGLPSGTSVEEGIKKGLAALTGTR